MRRLQGLISLWAAGDDLPLMALQALQTLVMNDFEDGGWGRAATKGRPALARTELYRAMMIHMNETTVNGTSTTAEAVDECAYNPVTP